MSSFIAAQQYVVVKIMSSVPTIMRECANPQGRRGDHFKKSFYAACNGPQDAAILRGEIVIAPKENCNVTMPQGRSMLNGIQVPSNLDTPEKQKAWIYDNWRVMGVAFEDVLVNAQFPQLTPPSVVAIHGYFTIPNTSGVSVFPGDVIRAKLPGDVIQPRINHKGAFSRQRVVMETSPLRATNNEDDTGEIKKLFSLESNVQADAMLSTTFFEQGLRAIIAKRIPVLERVRVGILLHMERVQLGVAAAVAAGAAAPAVAFRVLGADANVAQITNEFDAHHAYQAGEGQQLRRNLEFLGQSLIGYTLVLATFADYMAQLKSDDFLGAIAAANDEVLRKRSEKLHAPMRAFYSAMLGDIDPARPSAPVDEVIFDATVLTLDRINIPGVPQVTGAAGVLRPAARKPKEYVDHALKTLVNKRMDVAVAICSIMGANGIGIAQTFAKPGGYFDIMVTPTWMSALSRM